MSIGMSPFKAPYRYEATSFRDLIQMESRVQGARDFIQENIDIMNSLKNNLHQAQNQQKIYTDKKKMEKIFEIGDMVFLRLQPYKQTSINASGVEKLKPRFYGPYKAIKKIGEVDYKLEFPLDRRIHLS